ncbi:Probable GTP-binding protein OBGC2 [Linum perenne]
MLSMATLPPSSFLRPRGPDRTLFLRLHSSERCSFGKLGFYRIECRVARVKQAPAKNPDSLIKEPHKYFDQVIITVRSGDGGHGAVLKVPNQGFTKAAGRQDDDDDKFKSKSKSKSKKKGSFKRDFDGSLILPVGGHGGDVVIYADEGKDTLLELHTKGRFSAKRGTVVKHKRGKLLADLTYPGQEILVARGGQGGISLLDAPEHRKKSLMSLTTNVLRDDSDKVLILGQPGEELSLELILRVVADVGLVGLPNAGKSTLLSAITLARPDIADYPFTTLMPNLGRLDGDPALGPEMYSSAATLADLPGLIEGAHLGKELRMYNPEYLERPYLVVLNKIDLLQADDRLQSLLEEISRIGTDKLDPQTSVEEDKEDKQIEDYARPFAVVGVSVLKGIRVNEMLKQIRAALRQCRDT